MILLFLFFIRLCLSTVFVYFFVLKLQYGFLSIPIRKCKNVGYQYYCQVLASCNIYLRFCNSTIFMLAKSTCSGHAGRHLPSHVMDCSQKGVKDLISVHIFSTALLAKFYLISPIFKRLHFPAGCEKYLEKLFKEEMDTRAGGLLGRCNSG